MQWKKLSSKQIHQNPWYSVREDDVIRPDGNPGKYYVVEVGESAMVIPYHEGLFYLITSSRYTIGTTLWEFPSGKANPEESPEAGARRELLEETGITTTSLTLLGKVAAHPGIANEIQSIFLAEHCTFGQAHRDFSEVDMRLKGFNSSELKQLLQNERITDSQTLGALQLLQLKTDIKIF